MARKLIVEILGDSSSLERSFNRSTAATTKFGRNVDTTLGRVDSRFSKLQKVAAGGFIGGVAATAAIQGIKSVVNASAEAQQVLGQTRVALEATGNSWQQYGKQIQDTVAAQSKLGFDDEALLRTFSLFVRTTSDVTKSLRLNALAADVARGRFIDLEQAATLVNKAAMGQSGALRRLGIDVKAGASAQELLTALTEKYGGSAQAASRDATTGFDRAKVSLENVEEAIGSGLLPTLSKLAGGLADAADGTVVLIDGLRKIAHTKIPPIHIPFFFDTPGGTAGGFLSGAAGKAFDVFKFTPLNPLMIETIAARVAQEFKNETDKQVPMLESEFSKSIGTMIDSSLQAVAAQDIVVDASKAPLNVSFTDLLFNVGQPGFGTGATPADILGPLVTDLPVKIQQQIADAELSGKGIRAAHVKALKIITDAINDPRQKPKDKLALTRAAVAEQNAIDGIDEDAANAADSAAKDAAAKRDARRTKAAQDRADAARKARERRQRIREREAKEAARDAKRLQTRQFRLIGLGPEGQEIIPGVPNLRKQLAQLEKSVVGQPVPKKLLNRLAGVAKALTDPIHKATPETRKAIQELFDTIRGTFSEEANKPVADIRTVSLSDKILKALGFNDDLKAIQPKFTLPSINAPRTTSTAGALTARESNVNINGPVTVVANNPDAFLRELQKTAGRATATSRGRFPGRNLGLG